MNPFWKITATTEVLNKPVSITQDWRGWSMSFAKRPQGLFRRTTTSEAVLQLRNWAFRLNQIADWIELTK